MKEHSNTLRNTIIGTVVGGLLVSLILWLVGFLPTVWNWIAKAIVIFWGWLTSNASIPIWLVLITMVLILPTFIRIYHYYRQNTQTPQTNTNVQDEIEPEEQFNELEMKVLHVLSRADGERITVHDVSKRAKESQIRAKHALDTLNEKGLLQLSFNYMYGTGYFLNRHGRELVIDLGMA